jgi:hypothetical protein
MTAAGPRPRVGGGTTPNTASLLDGRRLTQSHLTAAAAATPSGNSELARFPFPSAWRRLEPLELAL